jgi:hypothetical protein
MLDNVIGIANLPLKVQQDELIRKRRHGIGFLGLGSMFNMMKYKYGDTKSIELTEKISKLMAITSINAGIDLAIEKGPAPIMNEVFTITSQLIAKNPIIADKFNIGDKVTGKELIIFSDYMQRMPQEIRNKVAIHGMRFSHATSIAPTGTMALGIGNNVSNGIEPNIQHKAIRNVIKTGKKTKEALTVYSYESLLYKKMFGEESELPDYFMSTDDLVPSDHIAIQAAAQPWIDSSISKCVAKGTRIVTDKGLIKVESFSNNRNIGEFENLEEPISVLCSDGEYYKVKSQYYDGTKSTLKLTFDNGIIKEVSRTHKFIDEKTLKWKPASRLRIGDKVLYKTATPLEFDSFHQDHYGLIHGILRNPHVIISKESISTDLDFLDLTDFCTAINSIKNLELTCVNNTISLDETSYTFLSKIKHEFSYNKLFKASLAERNTYIKYIRTNNDDLIKEKYESVEEGQNLSELLYSVGKDTALYKGQVIELSKTYITNSIIPSTVVDIEESENELFDISVENKHEYLISGLIVHNTINCPENIAFEDFEHIYMESYDKGLKSATTFRFNPRFSQGVIVKENDLKNTQYRITLEDNSTMILSGNESITYDNNESTVANLHEAIKEGYYNKF